MKSRQVSLYYVEADRSIHTRGRKLLIKEYIKLLSLKTTITILLRSIDNRIDNIKKINFCDLFNSGQYFAYNSCREMLLMGLNAKNSTLAEKSDEDMLKDMIDELCTRLNDLNDLDDPYSLGLKTAYVECLEIIQLWDKSAVSGLDFEIESLYPLM